MGLGNMFLKGAKYSIENGDEIQKRLSKTCEVMGEIGETQRNIARVGKGLGEVADMNIIEGGVDVTVGAIKGKKSGSKAKKGLWSLFNK